MHLVYNRHWTPFSLTVHVQHDPLGHGRGDPVGGDAQVRAHVRASQAGQGQLGAFNLVHWKNKNSFED